MVRRKLRSFGGAEFNPTPYQRRISPEKFFNMQFYRFGWYGYFYRTAALTETFQPLTLLAKKISEIGTVPRGHLPFLLVNRSIPVIEQAHEFIGLRYRVRFDLESSLLRYLYATEVFSSWYLLIDVEVGKETNGMRPGEATEQLLRNGRLPLDLYEGIALVVAMPEEIIDRTVNLPGCIYRTDDIPYLSLRKDRVLDATTLKISWSRPRVRYSSWGVASCRERVSLPET